MTLLKYAPGYSNKILDEKSGKEHCKTNTQIHKYAPGSQEPDKNNKNQTCSRPNKKLTIAGKT